MRITLASEHFDYYNQRGHITFQNLFSPEEIDQLEKLISTNTRDGWRSNDAIKKIVFNRNCAEIASELSRNKIIQFGFEQSFVIDDKFIYAGKRGTINDVSCIQSIACALVIRLSEGSPAEETTPFCPCPEKRGMCLFFSGKALISWSPFQALKGEKFLLIAYATAKPQYVAKKDDPFVNSLKPFGYAFGDHLSTSTHPVLFAK